MRVRTGTALVVATVLAIGAAACGSDSSTSSTGSASVANKEAGAVITAPHLIGLSNFEAENQANSLGLSVQFKFDGMSSSGKGIVVDQNPQPGDPVSEGQPIFLIVRDVY